MIGTQLLHYKILKKLGEGGQGEVYQAEDTRLRRIVAIKIMPAELVADEVSRKRFLREAQLASALDHPNICTIYEVNEEKNLHFIVMQYVEGKRLKQMVRGKPLEMESAVSIAVQLADALATAHERGVIHRDVKATNIIVNDRGQAKILDFGLAKATSSNIGDKAVMELTQTGIPFGTAGYMSPEQARGETIDARSDIFSLSVVVYEMVTGKLPFQGKTSVDVMHAVMHQEPPKIAQTNQYFSNRLQSILDRAMMKDKSARYQTMRELHSDFKQLLRILQSKSGKANVDDSLFSSIAPRYEKSGWLRNGIVGKFLNKILPTSIMQSIIPTAPKQSEVDTAESSKYTSIQLTIPAENIEVDSSGDISTLENRQISQVSITSGWKSGEKHAIAILPFKNLSRDIESDFYSFSLADSLITELARLKSLVVRPSSYIAKYQGQEIDPQQVGQELKVDAVLVSGYIKAGNRFRVTPQLIDIKTGEIIWSDKIDISSSDIITLQDTISQKIVNGLRVQISETEQERIAKPATNNAEAYEYYLRGRNQLNRFTQTMMKDDFNVATEMFENAIKLDDNFALAYSGLGLCYVNYVIKGIGGPLYFERAEEYFSQAIKIDETLIEPQSNMIYIHLLKGEKAQVRTHLKQILALVPNDPNVHMIAAYLYRWDGLYEQALHEYNTSIKLNPAGLVPAAYNRARIKMYQEQYGEALKEIELALSKEPDHPFARMVLGQIQYYQGKIEEASKTLKTVLEKNPDLHAFHPIYALCRIAQGSPDEALALIDDQVQDAASADGDVAYWLATVYAALKQDQNALLWLCKAMSLGNENYPWFKSNPDWKHLAEDAEFKQILNQLGTRWLELCNQYESQLSH